MYSAPWPNETRPLRLLAFDSCTTSSSLSLSLFDTEQEHEFFAVSYAWGNSVCKPSFGMFRSVSCANAMHGTPVWSNNKALCNNYLSYYRSGSDGYVDILINGRKFYVQDTVYHLLRTLWASAEIQQRFRDGQHFWLDAICVNQNDEIETVQQTSIMHEIYKAAQHVYVWLGTAYNSSAVAMDFLSHLIPSTSPQESATNLHPRTQSHLKGQYWPLYFLFIRPYWERTWVVQEFLLARDVTLLCGDRAVPWSKAEYLVSRLDGDYEFRKSYPQWAATPAVKIIQARKALLSSHAKPSLESFVHHFLFSQSTYPEDKLLGLLNVSLSNVQIPISGKSGSIERRVDVINTIVKASLARGMNDQTAQEWQGLLACLLGVRDMFSRPEKDVSIKPEPAFSSALSYPRRGPAASTAQYIGTPARHWHQSPERTRAASSYPVNIIGSVQSVRPVLRPRHLLYEDREGYKHPLPQLQLVARPLPHESPLAQKASTKALRPRGSVVVSSLGHN